MMKKSLHMWVVGSLVVVMSVALALVGCNEARNQAPSAPGNAAEMINPVRATPTPITGESGVVASSGTVALRATPTPVSGEASVVESGGGDEEPVDPERFLIWVSTTTSNGNMGGIAGANEICATDESRPEVEGLTNHKALLSSSEQDAKDVAPVGSGAVPVFRSDGSTVVSTTWDGLWDGVLDLSPLSTQFWPWTGATTTGTASASDCAGWTDATADQIGTYAQSVAIEAKWINYWTDSCTTSRRIYCVSW